MLNIILNGALGKMGRVIAQAVSEMPDISVVAGVDRFAAGARAAFPLFESLDACDMSADVIIDFSRPDALEGVLDFAKTRNAACVIATTGQSPEQMTVINDAALTQPVFKSANLSLGVNVMLDLVKNASLGLTDFDVEIVEMHHNAKVDSPSGTALMLADSINDACAGSKEYVYGRHTKTETRQKKELGIHAVRGGSVTGDHAVYFLGQDETVEVRHTAFSRRIFALGALKAARFLAQRAPGKLYTMHDLLLEQMTVQALFVDEGQALVTVRGIEAKPSKVAEVFTTLGEIGVNIDMVSQAAPREFGVDISFTMPRADAAKAIPVLSSTLEQVIDINQDVTKIAIRGPGMEHQSGVAGRVLATLAKLCVYPLLITTSETQIAVCVSSGSERAIIDALCGGFDLKF